MYLFIIPEIRETGNKIKRKKSKKIDKRKIKSK